MPNLARMAPLKETTARPYPGGTTQPTQPASGWNSTILGDWVGRLLDAAAHGLNPPFVDRSFAVARTTGHGAVLAGAVLTLLYSIYAAVKQNSFSVFLAGMGMIVAIAVAQFAARRFLHASEIEIANTPSQVSPTGFLDCVGLLSLLLALVTIVGGIITAVEVSSWLPLPPALFLAIGAMYFGAIALHPLLANVSTADETAGEEAIGLLSFFAKAALRLVPVFFCLLALGGCLAIMASFFSAGRPLADAISSVLGYAPFMRSGAAYGLAPSAVVVFACLLPLVAYFGFLLQYLFLDILRAILATPTKIDLLRH